MSPGTDPSKKEVTFVLGGAQSGKSHYAQELASRFERVTFIATGRPSDAEMRKKIGRHQQERPTAWRTIEAPLDVDKIIRRESQNSDVVLVDCLTFYVANLMDAKRSSKGDPKEFTQALCDAIQGSRASVLVVSNEVGSGVVPAYRSGRIYRDCLGQMNQKIAAIADRVVLMIAGVPVIVKDGRSAIRRRTFGVGQ